MRESNSAHLTLPDASATRRLGASLAKALACYPAEPFVIFLEGELGAGKTTLAGGLLAELGFRGPVRSPTYTLVEPYELNGGRTLHHVDLYRLATPHEVEPLGLRDSLGHAGVLLVEWPSKGEGQLPLPDVSVQLTYEAEGAHRRAVLTALTLKGSKLLETFIGVTEQ
jgi:tRNA threonylcarbamoyladenosine biosynthesis protein TsaE